MPRIHALPSWFNETHLADKRTAIITVVGGRHIHLSRLQSGIDCCGAKGRGGLSR